MTAPRGTIDALNRLLAIEYRSFASYLTETSPWTHAGDEKIEETPRNIVADQQAYARRIADMVLDLGGRVDQGYYPMEFTDMHFLSLDYLVLELVQYQRRDIAAIEKLLPALGAYRPARELAEETLGSERAHLEALLETVRAHMAGHVS